jgi:hypothetical protein
MRRMRAIAALLGIVAAALVLAAPASAQTNQQGLVNVAIEDVTVQLPISVAANICDVNVAVLAEIADEAGSCEATATSAASAGPSQGNDNVRQEGLVNVLVDDVVVQAPIAVAANVCDVNVAVLAEVLDDASACEAVAGSEAQPGSGQGGANATAFEPVDLATVIGLRYLDNDLTTTTGSPTPIF